MQHRHKFEKLFTTLEWTVIKKHYKRETTFICSHCLKQKIIKDTEEYDDT